MDDIFNNSICDSSRPQWENMDESPILEPAIIKYKLKLRFRGFFRLVKNSCRQKYCFGSQKSIYIDTSSYDLNHLLEEVKRHYPSTSDLVFSKLFVDKFAKEQSFIELNSDDTFMAMLNMYEEHKQVTIYVSTNKIQQSGHDNDVDEPHGENDSDYCHSEESYHSRHSTDEDEPLGDEGEIYSYSKKSSTMKENSKFRNVVDFRRALNHYAWTKEFEYVIEKSDLTRFTALCAKKGCEWRIHASLMEDKVTFEKHIRVLKAISVVINMPLKDGSLAHVVSDKVKSDAEVSVSKFKKWLMKNYNVDIPYLRVFRGKEQALSDMYGKWDDSYIKMDDFKEKLLKKNPGSIVDIDLETHGDKKYFRRFFISLAACSSGFIVGCRPYIGLDACHLKGKFNGVLAVATCIDGNNNMFPVAYGVLESENTRSWTWFIELLKRAIGTPNGLVISSDMQKGLEVAITKVYPNAEHRECMRHLYGNFKKKFPGDFFMLNLWGAARTYRVIKHDMLINEIASVREDAITYLNQNHTKIWSRSKFGTTAKCDYMTNNISETFNSWVDDLHYKPVIDLLDSIREKLMERFDKRRRIVRNWKGTLVPTATNYLKEISKNLGKFEVFRSSDTRAEVKYKGKRWEVLLDERQCTCRIWQVKGLPCVHASAFIAFIRDVNWDNYVDSYFTIDKCREAYALEIAPMPGKEEWVHMETREKIYPPIIKRPVGRPRKKKNYTAR